MEEDFLDEIIDESAKRNPDFPKLVDEAYQKRAAARNKSSATWMVIRVELLSGVGRDFEPPPGRDFLVSSQHTFRAFADAINSAFARWELSHLHAFRIGNRTIGTRVEDLDFEDDQQTNIGEHELGSGFHFEFDFGDSWEHRCTAIDVTMEPEEKYGQKPHRPIPVFGWGTLPDQYGRTTPGDG